MTAKVFGRPADAWRWLWTVAPAYLLLAAASVLLTFGAKSGSLWQLLLAALSFVPCTVYFDTTLRRQRALRGPLASVLRIAVGAVKMGVALLLFNIGGDAAVFFGVVTVAFVVSSVLAEARYSVWAMHVRGPVVLVVALLLVVLGLFPIAAVSAAAGLALAGIGVAFAFIGGELYTEDWLRARPSRTQAWMRWMGTGVLSGAIFALVALGSHPLYAVFVLAVVAVLVAAVSSDSDGAELIVVLVIALVWAAAPRDIGMDDPHLEPKPGESFFVAMGDSYISGEGADRFYERTNDKRATQCRRAPTAYPVRLARDGGAGIPDRVLFLACSGAVAVDIYGARPGRTEPLSQLEQYRRAVASLDEEDVEFVLLSLGGNDADFGVVGRTCVGPGDCSEIGQRWVDRLATVEQRLDVAYGAIAKTVGDVQVVVVPYPMPLREEACWWSWLSDDEHRFLTGFVRELNLVVEAAATRAGFLFLADMRDAFVEDDLRICDRATPGELGMNFIAMNPTSGTLADVVDPRNWTHNSIHPNATGHEAMFDVAATFLRSLPPRPEPDTEPRVDVGDVEDIVAGPTPELCGGGEAIAYCSQSPNDWQVSQIARLLRLLLVPLVAGVVGSWLVLAPTLRWSTERSMNLTALLTRAARWLRSRLRPGP